MRVDPVKTWRTALVVIGDGAGRVGPIRGG